MLRSCRPELLYNSTLNVSYRIISNVGILLELLFEHWLNPMRSIYKQIPANINKPAPGTKELALWPGPTRGRVSFAFGDQGCVFVNSIPVPRAGLLPVEIQGRMMKRGGRPGKEKALGHVLLAYVSDMSCRLCSTELPRGRTLLRCGCRGSIIKRGGVLDTAGWNAGFDLGAAAAWFCRLR